MTRVPSAEGSLSVPKILVALLLAAAVGLYVSGYFFLWAIKEPPMAATPLTTLRYWHHYGDRSDVRRSLVWSLAAGMGLTFGTGALALIPRKRPLHGDARFATKREIRKAGLLGHDGIILGRLGREYLMLPGQHGAELEAPPRSGKGVGVVIPNLLNWPGSVIVSDIKGENWTRTAGFRAAHGQDVHLFDPLSETERSSRWNALACVSDVPYRCIDDLQRIATMLYPDPQGADPFWTSSARSLFLGIALYLFETEGSTRTIGEILRQGMASDAEGFQKHWRRVIDSCERAGYPLSQEAIQTLYDVIDLAPVTASSIRKTFTSRLDLWLNPMIDAATSANDFDFRELRKRPISIYPHINPDNIARLQPLLNLFFQQAIGLPLTRELPEENPALKHQLLLVLDEFPALGRIPVIANSTAFLPGYNVRSLIIVQSNSQLIEKYGVEGAKSIRKMLAARIVYPPKEFDDAEAISKELGTYTVKQKSVSRPMWGGGRSPTVNVSDQPRRLLLPQEIKEMGPNRMILFYEGLRPVFGQRIYYYRDKFFAKREMPPPEVPKLDIAAIRRTFTPPDEAEQAAGANAIEPVWPVMPNPRPVRAPDVSHLDALTLDDFSLDFDDIEIPKGRPMTESEVQNAVDRFLATLAD
jgi:type IV secretion system protein VirD4